MCTYAGWEMKKVKGGRKEKGLEGIGKNTVVGKDKNGRRRDRGRMEEG